MDRVALDARTDFATKRFLVVDDMPEMIETVVRMLKHYGASDFFRSATAEEALAIAASQKIDCIISDFNMAPLTGLQLLSRIRTGAQSGVPRDQRFILLTGHGEADVVRSAMALDASGYVVKPVSLKMLVQAVERAFSRPMTLKAVSAYQAVKLSAAPV
jgi:two-component system, chemotaxis family, chemotaxis protein CheY